MTSAPIAIIVDLEPRAKGRPRFAAGRAYTDPATRRYERMLKGMFVLAMRNRPHLAGPVRLVMEFRMPIPRSWSRADKERARGGERAHTAKPDLDNLVKPVKDCLQGCVLIDDAQVCEIQASKRYGDKPGVRVIVVRLDGPFAGALTIDEQLGEVMR